MFLQKIRRNLVMFSLTLCSPFQVNRDKDKDMATFLKKQKLHSMFPEVDPVALDDLFESNK